MVPDWVGTSLVRTFRGDSSGQSILTRQVPGETDVLVWRRLVDYAARCGAGSWPQTAFWAITPVMSVRRSPSIRQNARRHVKIATMRRKRTDQTPSVITAAQLVTHASAKSRRSIFEDKAL